jgi:regulator of protease activity HflC (stomatin/prohibitin superfamily)
MKRLVVVCILALSAAGCSSVAPDAGHEAVLIRKPILFGHGGVDPTTIKTGRSFVAWTTQAKYVDVRPMQFSIEINDLMSRDGVPLDFASVIRVRINDPVKMVQTFGAESWYETNLRQPFFEAIRDAVKRRGMNEMAIDASAADAVDNEVTQAMIAYIKQAGLPVDLLDVNLGRANPPDAIKNQRTDTAAQEQRANTEKQRKLAEDQRREAEASRAAADNAYREAMRLTPDQFLQLEQIKMLNEVCPGGKCTFLLGAGAMPTVSVK